MDLERIVAVLLHGNQLKRTARTGWGQRGVPNPENVAAHTFGVAFVALVLAEIVPAFFNMERVLTMAILHDVPEGLTTDIPTPAWRLLPTGIKTDVERGAMSEIFGKADFGGKLMEFWEELHEDTSLEAMLVHDADKIDMFLQAYVYERQTGNQQLQEFWDGAKQFRFAESQAIYDYLAELRQK
jgi:putative hydrolase of HD superfamily